jgi:peptide-methionine (R)-S-oxide reductase
MEPDNEMQHKTEDEWRKDLTPEQYRILREKGTEPPFTGEYLDNHEEGVYKCAACGLELFPSGTKFDSQSGWPSFTDPVNLENVTLQDDYSFMNIHQTEVICKRCGSHLGHVYDDGPVDKGGKRYCINSCALQFTKKE